MLRYRHIKQIVRSMLLIMGNADITPEKKLALIQDDLNSLTAVVFRKSS